MSDESEHAIEQEEALTMSMFLNKKDLENARHKKFEEWAKENITEVLSDLFRWRSEVVRLRDLAILHQSEAVEQACFGILMSHPILVPHRFNPAELRFHCECCASALSSQAPPQSVLSSENVGKSLSEEGQVLSEKPEQDADETRTKLSDVLEPCKVEHLKFEEWATAERYDMHEHPLHYLFMDSKTNAARKGWKAALRYVSSALSSHQRSGE